MAIPVLVLLVANALRKDSKSFSQIGKEALEVVRKNHAEYLIGPRYNRDNYDPEKGQGLEYLFIKKPNSKQKAKFVPVKPLDEGVLVIYVQKGTLADALNYGRGNVTDDDINKIKTDVKNAVQDLIQNKYNNYYDIIENSNADTAIMIDFREQEMGKKKFAKAIAECVEKAVSIIVSQQK